MASAEEYAAWIVKNADKKGTPEFETVANAYREVKAAGMYGSDNSDQVSRKVSSADMAASREDQSPGGQMKAALDVLTSLGRGMVAKPAGDVAGLGSMLLSVGARGFTNEPTPWDKPQDIKESVQRAVAGDGPQTESGKYVMNIISKPGEWLDKGGQWAEDKIAPAGPDTPEDSPSRMVARAVHESINQAPMALGVAAPKLAGMAGGAMRESAINTMLKSMKPSQEDLKSGAARAAAETMVDRRLYNTPGGMDKTRALADGINRDVSQITAMSDNTADVSAMGPNIKQVIDQYAAKISESNEADKNAILAVWTSFLKNPMVNELTAPIAKRLYNAQQQLAKLKEEHAAATEHVSTAPAVDMSAPPVEAVDNGNFHPVPGMPRVSARVAPMGGPDEFHPVPGMPRVPSMLSDAVDTAAGDASDLAATRAQQQAALAKSRDTIAGHDPKIKMLEAEIGDLSRQLDDMSNQMTVESAQRLKQQIYKDTYARGAVQGAANDTKKAAARTFKDAVNEAEPSVKALNAEESKLLNVLDVAEGRALKAATMNRFGLSLLAHSKTGFISFMADRSPLFNSIIADLLNKGGKVLEGTTDITTPATGALVSQGAHERPLNLYPQLRQLPPGLPQQQTLRDLSTFKALPAP
jgi:uncharacterized protein YoxC